MEIVVSPSTLLHVQQLKNELQDITKVSHLQNQLDVAEKENRPLFEDFSDTDMMMWFLHQRKHLNEENDRSKRTIQEYKRELMLFIGHLLTHSSEIGLDVDYIIEGSLFKSLQPRHLRRYQEWLVKESPHVLKKGKYSAATLERKTTILRAFFSFSHEVQYIKEPLAKGLRIASVRKDDRPNRDMGPKQAIALLDTFREQQHPVMFSIVHVLTTTGIRNEEFCKLCVKDIRKDAILGGWYLDVLGKGNKRRQVPLKNKVINSIRMHRHARGLLPIEDAAPNDPLFTTNTGRSFTPSYLSQYVSTQIKRLDSGVLEDYTLKVSPHVFRHAFAIISKLSGTDLHDIMRSLGHEKIETTMIYLEKVFAKERHAIHQWKPEVFGEYI